MQSASYSLYHSAKGTSWKSKDHKYIAIENGRYIYPDDVARGRSTSAMNSQGSVNRYEQSRQAVQRRASTVPNQIGNIKYGGKQMTPSEYRAQVAAKTGASVNKDGSIRANSPVAREGSSATAKKIQSVVASNKVSNTGTISKPVQIKGSGYQNIGEHSPNRTELKGVNVRRATGYGKYKPGKKGMTFDEFTNKYGSLQREQQGQRSTVNSTRSNGTTETTSSISNERMSEVAQKSIDIGRSIIETMLKANSKVNRK